MKGIDVEQVDSGDDGKITKGTFIPKSRRYILTDISNHILKNNMKIVVEANSLNMWFEKKPKYKRSTTVEILANKNRL